MLHVLEGGGGGGGNAFGEARVGGGVYASLDSWLGRRHARGWISSQERVQVKSNDRATWENRGERILYFAQVGHERPSDEIGRGIVYVLVG